MRSRLSISTIVLSALLCNLLSFGWANQEPLRGPFSGRVVLPDGKPASGAKVFLVEYNPEPKVVQETQTDTEGKFSFDHVFKEIDGEPKIAAIADGVAMGYAGLAGWKNGSDIKLAAPTELKLKVLSPGGRAAAGVKFAPHIFVEMIPVNVVNEPPYPNVDSIPRFFVFPKSLAEKFSVETNADGELVIPGLPQGLTVRLQPLDTRFAQLPYETQQKLENSAITKWGPISLTLGATFRGTVRDGDGKPLQGVRVNAQGTTESHGGGTAVTGADGSFEIATLPEGKYNIGLDLKGQMAADWTAVAHADLPMKQGAIKSNMDFKLTKGGLAVGRVTDLDGKPIAGTHIGIYGPARPRSGAWVQSGLTDKDGFYRLRVPPGTQFIYLMGGPTGPIRKQMGKEIEVLDGKETKHDFESVQIG